MPQATRTDCNLSGGELFIQTDHVALDKEIVKAYRIKLAKNARISVTDTGIGMHKDTLIRVFDPFFTTKEKERGTR
jgi:signal transduction histidine kinase